ncbi:hypothetical protein MPTK1_4g10340 [Marchantia polymorpha subsp. ruderalis]|uniref:Uncharacterized protein n=2 Tax=Marchantia polymorpha TaxID=3197 RepID=A0AAF6B8F2_MARPO|nr:hypothetical protein MARPO_0011s0021 [Marchantia polymorpha]BBN08286.1 hypothetical protein Mp_4g10340 [Marchantia polymorpha subsp. ruderalis]|eukprot:PTQ46322.1 hypothetical protein MARPO_0011s0021 [Marchantia polymorpha]
MNVHNERQLTGRSTRWTRSFCAWTVLMSYMRVLRRFACASIRLAMEFSSSYTQRVSPNIVASDPALDSL